MCSVYSLVSNWSVVFKMFNGDFISILSPICNFFLSLFLKLTFTAIAHSLSAQTILLNFKHHTVLIYMWSSLFDQSLSGIYPQSHNLTRGFAHSSLVTLDCLPWSLCTQLCIVRVCVVKTMGRTLSHWFLNWSPPDIHGLQCPSAVAMGHAG